MSNNIINKIEKSFPLIKKIKSSNRAILKFKVHEKKILPGQFFMLNYKLSQKPISVYDYHDGMVTFLVESRGKTTHSMVDALEGEFFGLTGPLGNSFKTEGNKNNLLIAGGIGTAPILFLAKNFLENKIDFTMLIGEKNKENIIYIDELKKFSNVILYTDDGSMGKKGFPTSELEELFGENKFENVYICGPEIMMKIAVEKIVSISKSKIQICMERYMKCGIGLCGSCVLDDIGLRVCADGSVFDYEVLKHSKEFGAYKRDKSGVIEKF